MKTTLSENVFDIIAKRTVLFYKNPENTPEKYVQQLLKILVFQQNVSSCEYVCY